MFKQIIFPILLIALLPLVLKLMIRLRLGIALVYIVLANTLLMDWATAHMTLSNAILFGIFGITALRWLTTLCRKVREHCGFSRTACQQERLLAAQLRAAHADGMALEDIYIQSADGVPIVKYKKE